MQGDVKIVARAIAKARWPFGSWDELLFAEREQCAVFARAAMVATREIDAAELLKESSDLAIEGGRDNAIRAGTQEGVADWLQQRANDVKETGRG